MALAMSRPWKHPETGIYHLRRAVPMDLRALVGKWEEKRSLRTKDPHEAKRLFVGALADVEAEWSRLRASGPSSLKTETEPKPQQRHLTEAEAHERAAWLYRYWLNANAANPAQRTFWDPEEYQHLWAQHRPIDFFADLTKPLVSGDFVRTKEMEGWCLKHADQLAEVHDWQLDEAGRLCLARALAAATQRATLTLRKVARGELDPAVLAEAIGGRSGAAELADMQKAAENRSSVTGDRPITLDALLEGWWTEAKAGGRKSSTYESYRNTFRGLAAFLKRDDARSVTADDVLAFKDHRLTTPSPKTGKVTSAKTVKDSDLSALKTVFGWALINRKVAANPALGIQIKISKAPRLRSKGFKDAEARAILAAALAHDGGNESSGTAAAKRWVPWLCAFTGARVGEMAQLRKQDVRQDEGLWIIRITPEAGTVKTNEAREVVLHEQLIELGFGKFSNMAKPGHLFIKVGEKSDVLGPLQGLKNRLAEFARTVVPDPHVAPNHGWRHRFKTVGMEAGISPRVLDAIQGQAPRSVADTYGDVTLKTIAAAINRLPRIEISRETP